MFAKGKIGKSLLVAQLLHALSTGEPHFGIAPASPMPCVLIQADTPPAIWQDELTQAAFPATSPVSILFVDRGSLSRDPAAVQRALDPLRPCYVAYDALDTLFAGYEINDIHAKLMLSTLRRVAQSEAFTLIHHARKSSPGEPENIRDAAAGSRILLNQADQVVYLRSPLGPIEITGRLATVTYDVRALRRLPGGQWALRAQAVRP